MRKQTDVLVVGGGFGGVAAAQELAKNGVDVTLIDRKEYFEVTFATLRNVTHPESLGNTPRKRYSDFIKGTFIQANIKSMNDKRVKLATGEEIGFKQAIIATGTRYPSLSLAKSNSAYSYSKRNQEILNEHQSLAQANSILIIGGGLVGVELAGDIASKFPEKQVTLAQAGDVLLPESPIKAQQKALDQLTAKGVTVKFNRRFQQDGNHYRCTSSGETIQSDKVYVCVGMVPNTEFLQAELPEILNNRGLVKVGSDMKVEGYENLFSLGDCSTLDNRKHGYLAGVQGAHLAKNLLNSAAGKSIKPYGNAPVMVITTTGTDSGVATLPFFDITTSLNFLINLKQKDMGVSNMFKTFGTEPDSKQ